MTGKNNWAAQLELVAKFISLKMPYMWIANCRETRLELSGKLSPC